MTYRFHKDFLPQIVSHIASYDFIIQSLSIEIDHYITTLNNEISEDEFIHLQENYGLELV